MSSNEFVAHFGALYEHSSWIASRVHELGVGPKQDNIDGLLAAFRLVLDQADYDEKLGLICAHPDLAGKAALSQSLTPDSTGEQASAGLDQCNADELRRFTDYNQSYKTKFGFPFIMAVRGSNRHEILSAFETRLPNDKNTEFETAIREINKIAEIRLRAVFSDT